MVPIQNRNKFNIKIFKNVTFSISVRQNLETFGILCQGKISTLHKISIDGVSIQYRVIVFGAWWGKDWNRGESHQWKSISLVCARLLFQWGIQKDATIQIFAESSLYNFGNTKSSDEHEGKSKTKKENSGTKTKPNQIDWRTEGKINSFFGFFFGETCIST